MTHPLPTHSCLSVRASGGVTVLDARPLPQSLAKGCLVAMKALGQMKTTACSLLDFGARVAIGRMMDKFPGDEEIQELAEQTIEVMMMMVMMIMIMLIMMMMMMVVLVVIMMMIIIIMKLYGVCVAIGRNHGQVPRG
jgi:hypothetical protein